MYTTLHVFTRATPIHKSYPRLEAILLNLTAKYDDMVSAYIVRTVQKAITKVEFRAI